MDKGWRWGSVEDQLACWGHCPLETPPQPAHSPLAGKWEAGAEGLIWEKAAAAWNSEGGPQGKSCSCWDNDCKGCWGRGHPHTPKPVHSQPPSCSGSYQFGHVLVCVRTHTHNRKKHSNHLCVRHSPLHTIIWALPLLSVFEYKPIWRHKLQASLALRSQGHTQTHTRTHTPHGFPVCVSGSDSMPKRPHHFSRSENGFL